MKNTIRKIGVALLITIAAGVFTACHKDSSSDECKTDMQHVAGAYRLTAAKYKTSTTAAEQDFLPFMDACEKDDKIELSANGTYAYSDIGEKCAPDNSSTGTWSIKENTFVCKENDILDQGTISTFDCRQLVIYRDNIIVQGDRMTLTLTKQ